MTVRADATAVKNRLRTLVRNLPDIAVTASAETAEQTIKRIEQSAKAALGETEQVGFGLGQFLENIQGITPVGRGSWAILDTFKMGTVDDFQRIAGVTFAPSNGLTSLWHLGTQSGQKFRRLVFDKAGVRDQLARDRQQIWGSTTPQWILLEYGGNGGIDASGADPPVVARNFIGQVKNNEEQIFRTWNARIRANMRIRGVK